jgi:iron complex outermembrane receptor protein
MIKHMHKKTLLAVGVLSLLGSMSAAQAQEAAAQAPEPSAALDTIAVSGAAPESAAPDAPADAGDVVQLEEIIVTANKRKESARSLAGAVTAVDSARLQETGSSSFGDYLSLSPGVNFSSSAPGYSVVTIRGVSSDTIPSLAQTAVGVYYDDIPLTDPGVPVVVPDIDAFDAERVELLRGPQGALYGSASLGGAINYIPKAPNLYEPEFSAFASGNLATNSSFGGSAKLMGNVPLADGLGLRATGYYTRTPGYIDNLGTDTDQSNNVTTVGGRVILGWQVSDDSVLRLTALHQQTKVDDSGYVDESLGDLKKSTLQAEPSRNAFNLASLRYELGTEYGDWALIAGGQKKSNSLTYDGATALGLQALGQRFPLTQDGDLKGYSAELRFVSKQGDFIDYLAGVSYANRDEHVVVSLDAATLAGLTGLLGGALPPGTLADLTLFQQTADITAPEAAAFIDTNWHFGAVKLSAGGRYYYNVVDTDTDGHGLLLAPTGSLEFSEHTRDTAQGFNPKVSLAWQVDKNLLLYGLYSRGYRLGGPNLVPSTPVSPTKPSYGPDEVQNYEIGTKSGWFDGRLTFDITGFLINWKDIPLIITDSSGLFKYLDNAGDARIKGIETDLAMKPFSFLTARTALTWTDARLLDDYDPNNGRPPAEAGDRLPGAPEWTITNSLTGLWDWNGKLPSLTFIHRYEGQSASNLSFQDIKKGGYNLFDVRAGLRLGEFNLTAFCKNITDERGVTASNNYAQPTGDILSLKFITPPRTFGLELSYSYGE